MTTFELPVTIYIPIRDNDGEVIDETKHEVIVSMKYTPGHRQRPPSWGCAGEPADPPEVEFNGYMIYEQGRYRKPASPDDNTLTAYVEEWFDLHADDLAIADHSGW